MRYFNYSVDDFLADEFFQQWVLHPDEESDHFWQNWLRNHPEKSADVEHARHFLLRMKQHDTEAFSERQVQRLWDRIETNRSATVPRFSQPSRRIGFFRYWQAAAVVAGLLVAGYVYVLLNQHQRVAYQTAFGETQSITLPDGSRVSLNANSHLSFSEDWSTEKAP